MKKSACLTVAILVLGIGFFWGPTIEAGEADFYKGKTMTLMVPFPPGGGFDLYARALMPFIKKYTGADLVVLENKPGGGGNIAYNQLFNAVKQDGLTICIGQSETLVYNTLVFEMHEAKYDLSRFPILARLSWEDCMMIADPKSGIKSLDDLKKATKVTAAVTGTNDKSACATSALADALGLNNLKMIAGYSGSKDALMAVLRSETNIASGYSVSSLMEYVKADKVMPVCVYGTDKSPLLPNTPALYEMKMIEAGKRTLDVFVKTLQMGRVILTSPGIPEDRLAFLAKAVGQAIQDPEYNAEVVKMKQEAVKFMDVNGCRKLLSEIQEPLKDKAERERIKTVISKKYF
jgi:tripartite-type tricarboxylate transporter receptor subunit TctC